MATADHGGPGPDLYQLLGVPREASREEIAQAWRRRARDEHPDARPADADAPGRFRALAEAWRVLGDPARRAAYDRVLAREVQGSVRIPVRRVADPSGPGGMTPLVRAPGPPLRAGPVRVEGPRPAPPSDSWDVEDVRLALLAGLALRYLARDPGRPW
ncbi:MAG TPA: J domain-containing protein [Streptosporangiaceae bacterium]|nr:J domain-containing protein [Streptosporangiaceae bacterium]